MNKLRLNGLLTFGLVIAMLIAIWTFVSPNVNFPSLFGREDAQTNGPDGVSRETAELNVDQFADAAGAGRARSAPPQQPPRAERRSTRTTSQRQLSAEEERLIREALARQAERQALLEERAWAAADAPLGESIHDVYASAKARRAARLAQKNEARQEQWPGLPYVAAVPDYADRATSSPAPARLPDLASGTYIAARLTNDIRSELPGMARAMVSYDVFDSQTMRRIIIPRGTQLLGSYDNQTEAGQKRLFVYWTQMRLPDGRVFDLDRSTSADAAGASGLTGRRQTGFLSALVQGALLGTVQNYTKGAQDTEITDLQSAARIASGQSVSSLAERQMEQQLTRGTRFTVKAGSVVNIVLERPFSLRGGLERRGDLQQPAASPVQRPQSSTGFPVEQGRILPAASVQSDRGGETTPLRYDRDLYGNWADADGDCQNTRHEVLEALSTAAVQKTRDGCAVIRGRWLDPYTGQIEREARTLDVDHLVPLAWAHPRGGYLWDGATKRAFANDPRGLFATKAAVNREKGARSPLDWLPPNTGFHCEYVTRFERIVRLWKLEYRSGEAAAMNALRNRLCA